jgi:formylglycine-generating enzyme required for sulfatase activity
VQVTVLTIAIATACVSGCGHVAEAPPLPEALVVVDTNLPVPLVAGRLRVDLYAEDGTWFDTSDFGRPDRRDWPASFSVYSDDESRARLVWVRLRAYPEGAVDTYQGEARLAHEGNDVTPATEPSPPMSIDRLVAIQLRPETRGRLRVLLHGACIGTPVKMSAHGLPALGDSQSCIETEKTSEVVAVATVDDDLTTPTESVAGTWLTGTCPPPSDSDPRVCIAGGATILGSRENSDYTPGAQQQLDSAPPHAFGLSPFFVDRDELTVGALTQIVQSGYTGALPNVNDGMIAQPTTTNPNLGCTWSLKVKGRDDYPITCASFNAARAICQYRGGDLLTEAQWEHVASIAGHPAKERYPWGPDIPTCDRGVWGRIPLGTKTPPCGGGDGPRKITEGARDVSPLGVRGLFGSVSEWVLDDAATYDSKTWANVSLVDPHAELTGARRVFRGGSWMTDATRPIFRYSPNGQEGYVPIGVRCAYPVQKP